MAYTSSKKWRHGRITLALTVAVLLIAMLSNAMLTTLSMRYGWFINMNRIQEFPVSQACYDFLDTYVIPYAGGEDTSKIELIFCDEQVNVEASDTMSFVHDTATELAQAYPDAVEISYLNVWENPKLARSYGVTTSAAVIVKQDDRYRVCNASDFFGFSVADSSTPISYSGNKRFAVAMKAVISHDTPMCYVTLNHGETFPDYSLLFTITDAGYTVNYLDVLSFDIPEDCELLVTYNPTQDFTVSDGVSSYSEIDKLDAYMQNGGKYMIFVSADTFTAGGFANLEGYLATWGVTFDHRTSSEGIEECFTLKDTAHSFTTDGYTLQAKLPEAGTAGGDMTNHLSGTIRVANATSISVADDFSAADDGSFVKGDCTLTPLLTTYAGAEAWAGGRAADRTQTGYPLMTLSQNSAQNSFLLACSSTEFACEDAMQSEVHANKSLLLTAIGSMGKSDTPIGVPAQPFSDSEIHILTTADAVRITLTMTILPAALVLATGLIILIRRKFA